MEISVDHKLAVLKKGTAFDFVSEKMYCFFLTYANFCAFF